MGLKLTAKMNMHIKTKDLQKVAENNFMASTDTSGVALLSRYYWTSGCLALPIQCNGALKVALSCSDAVITFLK